MEGKLQTSFIPKKPLVENNKRHREPVGIFTIIGWLVFLGTLALAGGMYAYNQYLSNSIVSLNNQLNSKVNSFDSGTINEITTLNSRIEAAKSILNSHLAVSGLFTLISNATLQSIQFSNFSYTEVAGGKLSIAMDGKAPDFSSVALQSDTFSQQKFLTNQIFSGLSLNNDGSVAFKFTAFVNPSALKYTSIVAAPSVQSVSVPDDTSTTTP